MWGTWSGDQQSGWREDTELACTMTRDQGEDREGALAETGRGGESGPRCVPLGALSRQMVRVLLMSGTSSFCRRWAERSKTPGHHVSTAVSSLWPPGAGDPEGCRPPAAGIEAVPGPELAALSPELFFLRRSLKALLIAQSELPQPTVSSTPRAACISSDVASVLSPPPGGLGFLHFKSLTAGWTSASARRRTLCCSQWPASGTGAILSPAVREAFSNGREKLLSSCGTSPSRGALHVNQRPLTAAFVGRRQVRACPQPPEHPRRPSARAGEPRRDVIAGVRSTRLSAARSILVPSGVPTHVSALSQL